jgi:hypothetical protein
MDRVKLSGYRKFWLVKEKAEKKFKFSSLTSISNSKQNKTPRKKKQKKEKQTNKPFLAYGALRHHQWVPQFASV